MTPDNPAFDNVVAPGGGRIGLTRCPGACEPGAARDPLAASLDAELDAILRWGAHDVVTLVEPFELTLLGVEQLGERVRTLGLTWWHLPVTDNCAPGPEFEQGWQAAAPALHATLDAGGRVVAHCRAGMGRTGMIAARLLIERGMSADEAIASVRRARPGTIENAEQVLWVRDVGTH